MFREESRRLLREHWKSIQVAMEEIYAVFQSEGVLTHDGPMVIVQTNPNLPGVEVQDFGSEHGADNPPFRASQPDPDQAQDRRKKEPDTAQPEDANFPTRPENAQKPALTQNVDITTFDGITFSKAKPPGETIKPKRLKRFPLVGVARVLSNAGSTCQCRLFLDDPSQFTDPDSEEAEEVQLSVTAYAVQPLAKGELVPPGTMAPVIRVNGTYLIHLPVWMG